MAKILGTTVCIGGAMVMAFLKGPKLLHNSLDGNDLNELLLHSPVGRKWVIGALFIVGSSSCWSLWLILQVYIDVSQPRKCSASTQYSITDHDELDLTVSRCRSASRTWIP